MKIVKGTLDNGYYRIDITKNNKRITHRVHRLVAFAFCDNDNDFNVVDHIDRNKTNNNWLNLRWTTQSINMRNVPMQINNTSGVKGVLYDNSNLNKIRWRAQWIDNDKKKHSKSFSVIKYGTDEAKQMAINYRKEMEKLYNYL